VKATVGRLVARLHRRRQAGEPEPETETWEPTRTTARDLQLHGLRPWPDAAGVTWPGCLIECRSHLAPGEWADDVSAMVLRGRPGGAIHRRMPRLCQQCRDDAAI
jgi:hypothetical protein